MQGWAFKSASELARAIRDRKTTSVELLELYLARNARHGAKINAVVIQQAEAARSRAKAADAALAKGEVWGPLHGVPMTVKESYNVAGLPTTWGAPAFKANVPSESAVVVQRLEAAGAVVFGKSNVPLLLMDFQSYNEVYGTTLNPYDLARNCGGSSGGSAAALAAGLTGLEAGSDIGGSIRNPAHYCGVYGHKPTWNIVPLRGHTLGNVTPPDISVVGPLARSAEDLRLSLDIVAGADVWHAPGWRLDLPDAKSRSLKDYRLGVWLDCPLSPVDGAVAERLEAAVAALGKAGAKIVRDPKLPIEPQEGADLFFQMLYGALSGRLPDDAYAKALERLSGLAPDDKGFRAAEVRGNTQRHRDWAQANEKRHRLRLAWRAFFGEYDALLCPVAGVTAFAHDHSPSQHDRRLMVNGKPRPYLEQLFWAGFFGVALLPATIAPTGLTRGGLPVGLQIVGPEYGDRTTIEIARLLANEIGGFVPPKGYD